MAIPIRLVFGDKQVIQIQAQTFDISVDRKISAFPTPGAILERYAADTNTPEVKIDIGGIFTDDDVNDTALASSETSLTSITSPSRAIINFSSLLPTAINQPNGLMQIADPSTVTGTLKLAEFFTSIQNVPLSSATEIGISDRFDITTGSMNAVFGPQIARVSSVVSSTVLKVKAFDDLSLRQFKAGDKIIDNQANVVGTVQSATQKDTNNEYEITFTGSVSAPLFTRLRHVRSIYNEKSEFIGEVVGVLPAVVKSNEDLVFDKVNSKWVYEDSGEGLVEVNNAGGYAAGVTSITVDGRDATKVISVGDEIYTFKVHNRYNRIKLIGTVTSVSSTSIGFSAGTVNKVSDNADILIFASPLAKERANGDEIPALSGLILSANNAVPIKTYDKLYIGGYPPIEKELHNQSLIFVPSYWQESITNSPMGQEVNDFIIGSRPQAIILLFDATQTANVFTSGVNPSIIQTAQQVRSSVRGRLVPSGVADAIINVPIKGITTSVEYSDPTKNINKSPAHNLALVVKSALELTGSVVSSRVDPLGASPYTYNDGTTTSNTVAGAFSAVASNGSLVISQKYIPSAKQIDFFDPLARMPPDLLFSQTISNGTTKGGKKSAGDKVQDMLGLMSNARKGVDLLRGIQIPYDSLITSNNVTAAARNFFLTFGEININEKGSISNTRPASLPLQGLAEMGDGNTVEEDKGFIEKALEDNLPAVHAFVDFLISAGETIFVTLTSNPHGNDGGIRVIPNKFHVRYDAGDKYYAFALQLLASDFVIGV